MAPAPLSVRHQRPASGRRCRTAVWKLAVRPEQRDPRKEVCGLVLHMPMASEACCSFCERPRRSCSLVTVLLQTRRRERMAAALRHLTGTGTTGRLATGRIAEAAPPTGSQQRAMGHWQYLTWAPPTQKQKKKKLSPTSSSETHNSLSLSLSSLSFYLTLSHTHSHARSYSLLHLTTSSSVLSHPRMKIKSRQSRS